MTGQAACDACSTCTDGSFESAACTTSSDAVCSACDPSCLTCTGPAANQCTSCSPTQQLVVGECQSLCGMVPNPMCLQVAKANLQSNEKKSGKEKLKLQWKKITTPTTRASFGDPVTGDTVAVACIFDDGGALISEHIVDRGSQPCGTKPCWKLIGKEGFKYKDKPGSAAGIVQIKFGGGAATKGKAQVQGKNNSKNGYQSLPTGLAAALSGNTTPTIQLVTSDGFCVGATMNKVNKDTGQQYKAQKK
jgi:hypothetical protein